MKIAVISDVHSNCYALEAVLKSIKKNNISHLLILGDIFGYYPWAAETYQLLFSYLNSSIVIKGNHDQLLLDKTPPFPIPSYWEAAKQNEKSLMEKYPEALIWLEQLDFSKKTIVENHAVELFHGTPENPENGRYYPSDSEMHCGWYPLKDTILFLGHTHYPLIVKQTDHSGFIVNPGSVGQPRDGNPMPSWAIWSTEENTFELVRSAYDNLSVMAELKKMNWNDRAIKALNKTEMGRLL